MVGKLRDYASPKVILAPRQGLATGVGYLFEMIPIAITTTAGGVGIIMKASL